MQVNPIVLMVSALTDNYDTLRRALTAGNHRCDTRRADDVATALARIAGGGVALVFLDISEGHEMAEILDGLQQLKEKAPKIAVALWSDTENARLTALSSQTHLAGCVISVRSPQEMNRILSEALTGHAAAGAKAVETERPPANATVIAFMGAKGGVGTTTAAMNTAAALTATGTVLLAEIRPGFSNLHGYFHPGRMISAFANRHLLDMPGVGLSPALLWPVPGVPGMRILFGPQGRRIAGKSRRRGE